MKKRKTKVKKWDVEKERKKQSAGTYEKSCLESFKKQLVERWNKRREEKRRKQLVGGVCCGTVNSLKAFECKDVQTNCIKNASKYVSKICNWLVKIYKEFVVSV
jgi:hypothetical protein